MSTWISVKDRLPHPIRNPVGRLVLVTDGIGFELARYTSKNVWEKEGHIILHDQVTHWMLLPSLPKKLPSY